MHFRKLFFDWAGGGLEKVGIFAERKLILFDYVAKHKNNVNQERNIARGCSLESLCVANSEC